MNGVWQRAWRSASAAGLTAVVLAVLAVAASAPFAWRFIRAWWMPAPNAFVAKDDAKDRAQQYAAAFDPYVKQLDGRSLFYEPSAPGSEGEVIAEEPEEEVDPTAPAPTRYDGPAIAAIVLDTVWFSDGARVKVGEGKVGDMEVLSTNTPWDIRVKWRGTEFTVPFFDRDKVIFKDRGSTSSASTPNLAAKPVADTPVSDSPPPPSLQPASETPAAPTDSAPSTPTVPEAQPTAPETPR